LLAAGVESGAAWAQDDVLIRIAKTKLLFMCSCSWIAAT
jgi:hypothetical protein